MVKKARHVLMVITIATTLLFAGCVTQSPAGKPEAGGGRAISITGSAPMYPAIQQAAYDYMDSHPGDKITVYTDDDTTRGIEELLAGEITVCDSTRPPTDREYQAAKVKGLDLHMTQIASDAVCVLVNQANPVDNLSMAQLNDIFFTGKITDWGQLTNFTYNGTIDVYAVNSSVSGVSSQFNLAVAGNPASSYVPGYRHKLTDADINAGVASDRAGISFASLEYANSKVKVVSVNGVYPAKKTVQDTTYPLSLHLYMITCDKPEGLAKDFINYVLSAEGQKIVGDSGFISLT